MQLRSPKRTASSVSQSRQLAVFWLCLLTVYSNLNCHIFISAARSKPHKFLLNLPRSCFVQERTVFRCPFVIHALRRIQLNQGRN